MNALRHLAPALFRRIPTVAWVAALLALAPALVREAQGFATQAGVFSDLFCALWLAPVLLWLPRPGKWLLLLIWGLMQLGSFMLLSSMSRLPVWQDLHFLLQGDFLANSLAESASIPMLPALWLGSVSLLLVVCLLFPQPVSSAQRWRFRVGYVLAWLAAFGLHQAATRQADDHENLYAQFNPLHWLVADALASRSQDELVSAAYLMHKDLSGKPLLVAGARQQRNVLLVVLEGIPGLYVQPARDRIAPGLADNPVLMPRLSEWSRHGMVTPDFIVHNHQTIRGLYAILCSDMDKLGNATPKAFELQNARAMAQQCLPAQLGRQGFSTHFLQGAGLSFMGKDKVMPAIGFEQVHGSEWFTGKPWVKFGWGVDDKAFFEGATAYVQALQDKTRQPDGKPWFLTLLTVGTHQPYAVPRSYARRFADRRDAAVAYLDDAVAQFLDRLQAQGVLDNTLVVITSDESHGGDLADWVSTWGLSVVLAPDRLPARNDGHYALLDTSLSILDYLGVPSHELTWGRSLFRRYQTGREMVSNTAGRLRWLQGDHRYECTSLGDCRDCKASSLIGAAECVDASGDPYSLLARKAAWLDGSVTRMASDASTLRFANGEHLKITHPWQNEWMDNLIGAQYLDFPAHSRAEVTLRWRAIATGERGAQLKLVLKQSEETVADLAPVLPVIRAGEETSYSFLIENEQARSNFSFHLLAEAPMEIELQDFAVRVLDAAASDAATSMP